MCVESSDDRPRGAPGMKLARLAGERASGCAKELILVFEKPAASRSRGLRSVFLVPTRPPWARAPVGGQGAGCEIVFRYRRQQGGVNRCSTL